MRVYFLDLKKDQWEILAGQDWSMLTPNSKGISPMPRDIFYTRTWIRITKWASCGPANPRSGQLTTPAKSGPWRFAGKPRPVCRQRGNPPHTNFNATQVDIRGDRMERHDDAQHDPRCHRQNGRGRQDWRYAVPLEVSGIGRDFRMNTFSAGKIMPRHGG